MSNVLKVSHQETIRSLHEKGWSERRIARELGINRRTVRRYASKCTIPPTGSPDEREPKCTILHAGSKDGFDSKPAISTTGSECGPPKPVFALLDEKPASPFCLIHPHGNSICSILPHAGNIPTTSGNVRSAGG